jgi:hypothetical protein
LRFVTSISPKRIEHQQYCLSTWTKLGASIIAYQPAQEITALQALFPQVQFRPTEDTYRDKFVTLRAVAQAASEAPVLLVNSDLEVYANQEQFIQEWFSPGNDVRVGYRWNYQSYDKCDQEKYGLDIVRLTDKHVRLINDNRMALGIPGWDWWLPAWLHLRGKFDLTRINTPQFFHKSHTLNWQPEQASEATDWIAKKFEISINKQREIAESGRCNGTCNLVRSLA